MHLIHDHILRKVHGDVVLMPLSGEETDFRGMIVLNHTGQAICRLLQQETDRDALIAELPGNTGHSQNGSERTWTLFCRSWIPAIC